MAAVAVEIIKPTFEILTPGTLEVAEPSSGVTKEALQLPRQTPPPPQQPMTQAVLIMGSTLPSARPEKQICLGVLRDPEYRLRKPIPLSVSVEESEVVLAWSEIDEFGRGETTSAALDDFGETLRELYSKLHAPEVRLGADLQRVKQVLDEYIEPRTR